MDNLNIEILEGPGQLPVHLQILYRLEYAIGFGQLPDRTKLPSVRDLAARLGVAPNTVARAYQQLQDVGLLETRVGRGTFVRAPHEHEEWGESRISTLREILKPAIQAASAIGFPDAMIEATVHELLRGVKITVGFVGINEVIVDKWSAILTSEFSDLSLEVIALTLDDVQRDAKDAARKLKAASLVLALLSTWTEACKLLRPEGVQIVAILSELSAATHQHLGSLPPLGPIGLVSEDHYASNIYGILTAYIDLDRVHLVAPDDEEGIGRLAAECAVIIHTLTSADQVVPFAGPETELIEVEFVPNPAALVQLQARLLRIVDPC
jgi:DNA-binding transcriptional regulator YhcF (GntR family)